MRRSNKTLNTERIVRGLYDALTQDLCDFPVLSEIGYSRIGDPRSEHEPLFPSADPYLFKKYRQLTEYHKRFIFVSDKPYEELVKEGFENFILGQQSFALPALSQRATVVVREAQSIVKDVLGDFCLDTFATLCAPGKRAALGLKRRDAYLDRRFDVMSGSRVQKHWFDVLRCMDKRLMRMTRVSRKDTIHFTDEELKVTAVPKSYKSIRTIAPDTVIGGFLSRGLGNYIRSRLEDKTHIDLAKQQQRHKKWAASASKRGDAATIDMSKASDSFTWDHIKLLTPKSWHPILRDVGLRSAIVGDVSINLSSYMLMGQGHTFPLQTLLFYAVCEATRRLLKSRGKVSVYGDDIMLPSRTAHQTITILTELGFTINEEKSFYDLPDPEWPSRKLFRESCGGDYYDGVDVRPFMPQGSSTKLRGAEACAFLHKCYNGLCERWDPMEVPSALLYLLVTLQQFAKIVQIVPDFEGDEAGIRLSNFPIKWKPVFEPAYPIPDRETWLLKYHRVISRKKKRKPEKLAPYLWYKLWVSHNSKWDQPTYTKVKFGDENIKAMNLAEAGLPLTDKHGCETSRDPENRYCWATCIPKP